MAAAIAPLPIVSLVPVRLAISARDSRIIAAARARLGNARVDFATAVSALREAVEEDIRGGRIYFLGACGDAAIVGSVVSGVGIVGGANGVELVRVRAGAVASLGRFA